MYRKIFALIVLIIYLIGSTFVIDDRDPGNTSWIVMLVVPIFYYLIFGMIVSFLLGVKYKLRDDIFMVLVGFISMYITLIPIIYYGQIKIFDRFESFIMMNNSGITIKRSITILLGLLIGGFVNGAIKRRHSGSNVHDTR